MPKYGNNKITFGVQFKSDQASVKKLSDSLRKITQIKPKNFKGLPEDLIKAKDTARQLQKALQQAFNVRLGSLNVDTFTKQLGLSSTKISQIYTNLSKVGAAGKIAFNDMTTAVLTTNTKLKETQGIISRMGQTMTNTIKWGIASSVMNNFTNSVREAFQYVKSLDSALTDIRIVTGDSTEQMARFADQANRAAQELGRSTMDYTKSALTFYQQGLSDQDVAVRTEATLKAQNITGAGQEMADYLTAVWNGYKVANEEAQLYVDKLAAVADSSASNMSQLAIAMSKVASTANMLGVPVDSLNAQIATIVATTRQAPESVGNALKTIYARINDIATGADDAQISLGNYSEKMLDVGISVLDANGNLRDTGEVIEEIGGKWGTLSREQQIYLARTMAGQRQYNNLLALFENWGKYTDLVNISMQSQGTTMQKNARYMDSLAAHMEQFGAAGERVKAALINEDDLKGLVDFGTDIVNLFGNLIESIGGGRGALINFGTLFVQLFSGTISKEINNVITHFQTLRNNALLMQKEISMTELFGQSKGYSDGTIEYLINAKKEAQAYYSIMSASQKNEYDNLLKEQAARKNNILQLKEQTETTQKLSNILRTQKRIDDIPSFGESMMNNLEKAQKRIDRVINKVYQFNNNSNNATKKTFISDYSEKLKQEFEGLNKTFGTTFLKNQEHFKDFEEKYNKLINSVGTSKATITDLRDAWQSYKSLLLDTENSSNNLAQSQKTKKALEQEEAELKRLIQAREEYLNSIRQQSTVKLATNMVAGLGTVASVINNIVNLTKIWNNQSLSTGEKILQTFTSLSMTGTQLVAAFSRVSESYGILAAKVALANQEKIKGAAADTGAAVAATEDTVAQTALGAANVTGAAGAKKNAIQQAKLGDVLNYVAVSAGKALLAIAPYALAIGAVAGAVYVAYKAWNKEAEAASKAAQVAEKTSKTYEDIKQNYEDLKKSLQEYNSAQTAIESLTRGTQQWRDVIRESNDSVIELLNNYPKLANYIENVNGQLKISQEGQTQLLKAMSASVNATRGASILASFNARTASNNALAASIGHEAWTSDLSGSNAIRYAGADEVIKVTEALHGDLSQLSEKVFQSSDELVQNISEETGVETELVTQLLNRGKDLQQLSIALKENQDATEMATKSFVRDALQEDSLYKGLDEEGKALAEQIGTKAYQAAADKILKDANYLGNINRFSTANDTAMQNVLAEFQKAMGDNSIAFAKNAVTAGGEFNFLVDGDTQKYTKQQVAQIIASSKALQELGASAKTASNMLADFKDLGDYSTSKGLNSFISGQGFDNLTKSEIESLNGKINIDENGNIIKNQFSEQLKGLYEKYDQIFQQMGYESADQFIIKFNEELESSNQLFNNLGKTALPGIQKSLQQALNKSNFNFGQAKGLESAFSQAFKHAGTAGLEGLQAVFSSSHLSEDQVQGLSEAINNIDWTQNGAAYELTKALEEQHIHIDDSTGAWSDFIDKLEEVSSKAHNGASAIDSIRNSLKQLKDVQDLDTGDIIDDQQYNNLIKINPQLQRFFLMTADGYAYIADKGDMSTILGQGVDQTIEHFKELENVAKNITQFDLASAFNSIDFSDPLKTSIEDIKKYTATGFGGAGTSVNDAFALLGISREAFDTAIETVEEGQRKLASSGRGMAQQERKALEDQVSEANAYIQEQLEQVSAMQADYQNGVYDKNASQIIASQADSLSELGMLLQDGTVYGEDFAKALKLVSDAQMEALGFDTTEYENYVDLLAATNPQLAENEYLLRATAKEQMRVSKGTEDLIDNWEDWSDILLDFKENGDLSGLAQNWDDMRAAIANLFNMDAEAVDLLGPNFIANNLDKFQAVKDGIDGAYEDLQATMDQELILKAHGVSDFSQLDKSVQDAYNKIEAASTDMNITVGAVIDDEKLINAFNDIIAKANWTSEQAQAAFSAMGWDVKVKQTKPQKHTDTENTSYYIPPVYTTQPVPWDLGVFGSGIMHVPRLSLPGHYQKAEGGVKETYQPGTFAVETITKNGRSGGNISRQTVNSSAPRSGGSGGRGGGGGNKGSTPKAPSPGTQAKLSEVKIDPKLKETISNPYQQIEKSYDRQADKIKKLEDLQQKVTGAKRLNILERQNKALEKQNEIIKRRQKISEDATKENTTANLRSRIEEEFGTGKAKYDQFGQVQNETALQNAAIRAYNKAATQAQEEFQRKQNDYNDWITNVWNKYNKDQQQAHKKQKQNRDDDLKDAQDAAKEKISVAEKEYKKRTDLLKDYQKAREEDLKMHEEYLENLEKMVENHLDKISSKLELKIKIGEDERDWLQFRDKIIKRLSDDDIYGQALSNYQRIGTYFDSDQLKTGMRVFRDYNDQIEKLQKKDLSTLFNITGLNDESWAKLTAEEQQNLIESTLSSLQQKRQEAKKQVEEDLMEIFDTLDQLEKAYIDSLEAAGDAMDEVIDQYELVNDLIDHDVKMTQLLYGDKGYQTLNKYYEMQHRNNQQTLNQLMNQREYWNMQLNSAEVGSEAWKIAKQRVDDLVKDINSKLEQMMENLSKIFENRLSSAVQKVNNKLTNGLGTTYLDQQWDLIGKMDENFLDTVNRKLGTEDVTRVYQQALNDAAGNPKQYQRINALMNDQLKILKEKDKLTEYDVERAKAVLEVEKARMALEDARNNKTKMRLRRDSQGNYTYQYVADEEKLDELEAALEDAQNNLYNQDKEHYKQNLNALYETYKEYLEKRKALEEEYAKAKLNEDAEEMARIEARIKQTDSYYNELFDGLSEDNKVTIGYLGQSFSDAMGEEFKKMWAELAQDEQWQILMDNVPWASSNIQNLADAITAPGGLAEALRGTLQEFRESSMQYATEAANTMAQAGTSAEAITAGYDPYITKASQLTTVYKDLSDEAITTVDKMEELLGTTQEFLNKTLGNLNGWIEQLFGSMEDFMKYMGWNGNYSVLDSETGLTSMSDTQQYNAKNGTSTEYQISGRDKSNNFINTGAKETATVSGSSKSSSSSSSNVQSISSETISNLGKALSNATAPISFLESFSKLQSQMGLITNGIITNSGSLDQHVDIQASFPNVVNREEIEAAFTNLVNIASMQASQYNNS